MFAHRSRHYFPLGFIVVGTALLAIPFHLRPQNFIVDDGYFYPQIARYIAHGLGSTFNGIMLTNGYHPLWMFVCVAAAFITGASVPLLQIIATIQDVILLACVLGLFALARAARMRGAAFGSLVILFFSMVLGIWRLLESPLALLLQITALALITTYFPAVNRLGRWRAPLLGAVLGLALLARLDLIFFVLLLLLYHAFCEETRKADKVSLIYLADALVPAGMAGLVVAPYLLWNWRTFHHHLLPISGAIKSTFPHIQKWHLASFVWPVAGAILVNATLLLKRRFTSFDTLCLLTAGAAALHLAYTLSFGGLAPWYLTTGYLSVALCMMWTFTALAEKKPILARLEIPLACLGFLLFLAVGTIRSLSNLSYTRLVNGKVSLNTHYLEPKRALALQLEKRLPPGSRLFLFDAPGGVAYFSGLSVLPVDGLVANYAYNCELVEQGAEAYAASHQIRYLIAPLVTNGQVYDRLDLKAYRRSTAEIVELQAPLTHKSAGRISLPDSDLLFPFRQINPDLEKTFPLVGVWRIPPPGVSIARLGKPDSLRTGGCR